MDFNKPGKLKPGLLGGVLMGAASAGVGIVGSFSPVLGCLNCACCGIAIAGGALASFLYLKAVSPPDPPYSDGLLLGLVAGVSGAFVHNLISVPVQYLQRSMGWGPRIEDLDEALQQMKDANFPQWFVDFIETLISSPALGATIFLVVSVILYSILAAIGGVVGIAIFHKKK